MLEVSDSAHTGSLRRVSSAQTNCDTMSREPTDILLAVAHAQHPCFETTTVTNISSKILKKNCPEVIELEQDFFSEDRPSFHLNDDNEN
ncbi:hypothetical protein ACF0H5_007014 [Mactra antiquata]